MSSNTLINAVIALIENRPKDAREMIRSSGETVNSGALQTRLAVAIQMREHEAKVKALKDVLTASLKIDIDVYQNQPELKEAYVQGIGQVESIIDYFIEAFDA